MRIAAGAAHFGASHAETVVVQQAHVTLLVGMRKTRPSAMRFELRIGCEELGTARAAVERTLPTLGEKAPRERRLGSGFTQDVVPLRTQFRLPLLLGFLYFGGHVVSHDIPRTLPGAGRMRPRLGTRRSPGSAPLRTQVPVMKLLFEILLSLILHPIAMILMWINLATRGDMSDGKKIVWFIVSIVWGLGPILYVLVTEGSLW